MKFAFSLFALGLSATLVACASEDSTHGENSEASALRQTDRSPGGRTKGEDPRVPPQRTCTYDGKVYTPGQTFPDVNGCDVCTCGADGNVSCTDRACAATVCKYNGKEYRIGDQYPDVDCCNLCTCEADGTSACGGRLCGPGGGPLCR